MLKIHDELNITVLNTNRIQKGLGLQGDGGWCALGVDSGHLSSVSRALRALMEQHPSVPREPVGWGGRPLSSNQCGERDRGSSTNIF